MLFLLILALILLFLGFATTAKFLVVVALIVALLALLGNGSFR